MLFKDKHGAPFYPEKFDQKDETKRIKEEVQNEAV
jgi:hypothetical protein